MNIPLVGEYQLVEPGKRALKVDHLGNIYIADRSEYRILKFSPEGKFIKSMGKKGNGPGEFKRWFGEFAIGPKGQYISSLMLVEAIGL